MTSTNAETLPIETLVALSLLRLGTHTKAALLFRQVVLPELTRGECPAAGVLGRLAQVVTGEDLEDKGRALLSEAAAALGNATRLGQVPVSVLDASYPSALANIPDPPIVLWTVGDLANLARPSVALVGSRRAGPTGLSTARRFASELSQAGLVVVSGLARGVDAAAHRGALDGGGRTVAVLGNGLDVAYPREHGTLAAEIRATGALVSEFPPGTRPFASHFPLRNRIISGLSSAVVVIEASEKSGSLITARAALEQGRDVLAVPGSVVSGCYRGCHALIKDGARLVETVDDILDEIGLRRAVSQRPSDDKLPSVNQLESYMTVGEPVTVDELATRTGRPAAEWLAGLGMLEVAGRVARLPGGAFVRLDGPATNRQR